MDGVPGIFLVCLLRQSLLFQTKLSTVRSLGNFCFFWQVFFVVDCSGAFCRLFRVVLSADGSMSVVEACEAKLIKGSTRLFICSVSSGC